MPNFTCPSGGTWHACATGSRFVGCCTSSDPCALGCSAGNLQPASFDAAALFGRIPDLDCGTAGSLFYTCAATDPPFWGCCKNDPCGYGGGCARADLGAAYLGANAVAATYYGVAASATASATASASSSSSSPSSSPSPSSLSSSSPPTTNKTTIIAAAVGGIAGGILITASLAFLIWRRARRHRHHHHHDAGPKNADSEQNAPAVFLQMKGGVPATEKQLAGTAGILLDSPSRAAASSPLLPPHQRSGVSVFELESNEHVGEQRKQQRCPPAEAVELMAEPVERIELAVGLGGEGEGEVVPGRRGSAAGSGRVSVDGSVASSIKHAQCTDDDDDDDDVVSARDDGQDTVFDVPQVSPQSASFNPGRNHRDSGVSSLRSVRRSPELGRREEVTAECGD